MDLTVLPWHKTQWARIQQMRRDGRMPHAMLFTGPEGVGIEQFLTATCASEFCEVNDEGQACGRCRACLLFQSGNHPDFLHIEPDAAAALYWAKLNYQSAKEPDDLALLEQSIRALAKANQITEADK